MKYLVIFDKAEDGTFWAQVPDLPGCFSSGDTIEEAKKNIVEAIELHIEGLREEGLPIPTPETQADFVKVA
ncbi:MAG TPA: type II toxin-antitoxin system HicB family antitoxin [Chitinophagales bacterium]|nr:type II toxin-antitoxin system HicB family antitoxin [Chitinophagales bacterium]